MADQDTCQAGERFCIPGEALLAALDAEIAARDGDAPITQRSAVAPVQLDLATLESGEIDARPHSALRARCGRRSRGIRRPPVLKGPLTMADHHARLRGAARMLAHAIGSFPHNLHPDDRIAAIRAHLNEHLDDYGRGLLSRALAGSESSAKGDTNAPAGARTGGTFPG